MLLQPTYLKINQQATLKGLVGKSSRHRIPTRTNLIICNNNAEHPRIRPKKLREDSSIPCNSHASFKLVESIEQRHDSSVQDKSVQENDILRIRGGQMLSGHATISGAKNSALVILAGAICSSGEVKLTGIPDLQDIFCMTQAMASLGCKVTKEKDGEQDAMIINSRMLSSFQPCSKMVRKLRASFLVLGPLLARVGEAVLDLPGGCNIGSRPVDLHLRGLEALGASFEVKGGKVHGRASKLTGAKIYLDYPSVGATETLMMVCAKRKLPMISKCSPVAKFSNEQAAALADGETTIANVAQEPEVVDLACFLTSMGAKIRGAGTNSLYIQGVKSLGETEYHVIPDRIEAGTLLIAGAITRSTISVSPVVPQHLTAVIAKLQETGCQIFLEGPDRLRLVSSNSIKPVDITTLPYPGFPTDMQNQFLSLLCVSEGTSVVRETVFENRFSIVGELERMGGKIRVSGNTAIVEGVDKLTGCHVLGSNLRSAAALVLAGLVANGTTTVEGVHHLDRGYEALESKLRKLGASIVREEL